MLSLKKNQYKVLARKYRPDDFSTLIGQEPLVRTISNSIKSGRISHAFLLTGIRGVGKTTTARIIAKTLNCTELNKEAEIIIPCGSCENCLNFAKGAHPDVIELDAASKTGVNDIRELIEISNYLPMLARNKIYIIDEVHMLSINAFNALLKTLEEPPNHVKFIFATTELRKIPLTILSRCQRFDLRRLSNQDLVNHLANIAKQEEILIENQALNIIAIRAEGSVRDSLSLLDQATNSAGEEKITAKLIDEMLGSSSKSKLLELLEFIIIGNANGAVIFTRELYNNGAIPLVIIEDLLEIINLISKIKLAPELIDSVAIGETEKISAEKLAQKLDIPAITTLWQLLLKGLQEIKSAPIDTEALEMVLIKICYLSESPSLHDFISEMKEKSPITAQKRDDNVISNFKELVQLFYNKREFVIYHHLTEDINLVKFEPPIVTFRANQYVPKDLINKAITLLLDWTGQKWSISLSEEVGSPSLGEDKAAKIKEDPIVQAALNQFSGANIAGIKNS